MKIIAHLVLFFTICFLLIFIGAGAIKYLELSVNAAKAIPAGSPFTLPEFIAAIREMLPLALYFTLLLTLSYAARRNIAFFPAFITLFILAAAFTFGSVWGLLQAESLNSITISGPSPSTLGQKGLILSQGNTAIVLLGNPGNSEGPRVISQPGQPLIYQETPPGPESVRPQAPFRNEHAFLTSGIFPDLSLTANQLESRFRSDLLSFGLYGGALILLLLSLRFVMELSSWPMANLFSGAVIFRGILVFETFIDSREVQSFLGAFLGPRIPSFFISPVVFGGIGVIILIYTLLIYAVRSKGTEKKRSSPRRRR
ncbi:MAG: hypothetical protein LBT16_00620 [Treponema sp.]|jgi:hypothetical protein|nr:hypothetical protein [Treponema sp.]